MWFLGMLLLDILLIASEAHVFISEVHCWRVVTKWSSQYCKQAVLLDALKREGVWL